MKFDNFMSGSSFNNGITTTAFDLRFKFGVVIIIYTSRHYLDTNMYKVQLISRQHKGVSSVRVIFDPDYEVQCLNINNV